VAFTYRIDKADGIVYLEGEQPGIEEWRQTLLTVFADPDFKTGFHFLSDRRQSAVPRSAEYLRSALNFLKLHADEVGKCKWATVVSTKAAFGTGRMAQFISESMGLPIEVSVFADIDEARLWLLGDAA
jgi:hypothetical protein